MKDLITGPLLISGVLLQLLGYDNGKTTDPMLPWQTPLRQISWQCMIRKPFSSLLFFPPYWQYASVQLSPVDNLVNFGQKSRCHGGRRHP